MGEVYRAHDARLGRDVAVKVLPSDISADPVRRQRFDTEARAVAALNHPNICAIHDVGSDGGIDYLVLELVDGETLAARLARGPLPVSEALARAREIAAGVAAAHRLGVVHRDLKPGNIMLAKSGVKILDFGLAKILRDEGPAAAAATGAATGPLTGTGVVLGTLQYMSPEQIEGRPADSRSDVFAFGTVLYEMLTGRKAFEASSTPGLVGAILRDPVPAIAGQAGVPPTVDRVIQSCIAKNPDDRFASMHDVGIALDWISRDLQAPAANSAAARPSTQPSSMWWAAAAALVLAASLTGYQFAIERMRPAAPPTYIFDIALPPGTTHWAGIALSPDARRLALVTHPATPTTVPDPRLWIRDLATTDWQLVSGAGDEIPRYPFWSPDGRSLAFFVGGNLVRVDLPSTAPIPICDAPDGRGGVWLADGTIVFAPTPESGLMRVNASGGRPEIVVERQPGESGLKFPSAVGGRRVIFWAQNDDPQRTEIRLLDLADPRRAIPIVQSATTGVFDGTSLYYFRSGVLVRQPFDVDARRLASDVTRVSVDELHQANVGTLSVTAAGGHVAIANVRPGRQQLQWVDRQGQKIADVGDPEAIGELDLSLNGRRLAVERSIPGEIGRSLWVVDAETGASRRILPESAGFPLWAHDSRRLAFRSLRGRGGNGNLYQLDVDSAPTVLPIVEMAAGVWPVGWIPGGNGFVFFSRTNSTTAGIQVKEADGKVWTFRNGGDSEDARLSLDGGHLAYESRETGQLEVFVDSFPSSGHPQPVSHGGGVSPRWRADGRELFFITNGLRLMAASVSRDSPAAFGTPSTLFTLPSNTFAVHPDGQRFLVAVPTSSESATVRLTLNVRSP
jgi:Tol biopolymer transport system component